jgi:hypothetical protein
MHASLYFGIISELEWFLALGLVVALDVFWFGIVICMLELSWILDLSWFYACMDVRVYAYVRSCVRTCVCTSCMHARMRACMLACGRACEHVCVHTPVCILNANTHTCMHLSWLLVAPGFVLLCVWSLDFGGILDLSWLVDLRSATLCPATF